VGVIEAPQVKLGNGLVRTIEKPTSLHQPWYRLHRRRASFILGGSARGRWRTNSEQELVKARLTIQIYQILRDRKATQTEAARLLGTTQAQVSALMRCRPVSVSVGKLMEFLTILGQDVEVTVKPGKQQGAGHMSVTVQPG
jgi:predicted XRE-type DNA-binding protein